jgi:hypothetical protein
MKRKHQKTLELIFKRPVSGNIQPGRVGNVFLVQRLNQYTENPGWVER